MGGLEKLVAVFAALVFISATALAENEVNVEDQAAWRARFEATFGAETIDSEQQLSTTQPKHLDNRLDKLLQSFSPRFGYGTGLPKEFTPGAGQVFRIPTVLVPVDESLNFHVAGHHDDLAADMYEVVDGKKYQRLFVHPADVPSYAAELAKYPRDPHEWYATPSSSNRSLLVLNGKNPEHQGLVLKLSLHQYFGGAPRSIGEDKALRGVSVSALVAAAHGASNGKLRGGKNWYYMPEFFSALPPGRREGGYIARALPRDVDTQKDILIPYYALLSGRPQGPWFEELYRASGNPSRKEFLWNDIMQPLLDMYTALAVDNGLIPELHKQNAGLVIDRATRRVKGPYVRDMDGFQVDTPYRAHLKLAPPPQLPAWTKMDPNDILNVVPSQLTQSWMYYYMGMMNIEQLAKGFLKPEETLDLMKRSDKYYVDYLNQRFGARLRSGADIPRFWDSLHRRIAPAIFHENNLLKRTAIKIYAHMRQWEVWADAKFRILCGSRMGEL